MGCYPRPDGRGPIEASFATNAPAICLAIRDLTVAAPLKHEGGWWIAEVWLDGYPRPDGRGPIEAIVAIVVTPYCGPIRDLTVAAPLKRAALQVGAARFGCYPRPDGRGPIEAQSLVR